MAKPKKTIFTDTNIFLHYKFFTEIDWPSVIDAGEVTIVIPPIVMRELEKHKYGQKEEVLKRRAEKVSARLAQLFRSGEELRPRTKIAFERREPDEEFASYRLSRGTQDDHLLASICLYKREHADEDVWLITNDLPLEVKAAPLGIETRGLPEDHRLPAETDPQLKRVRELEEEVRSLTQRIPRPELLFDNGLNRLDFNVFDNAGKTGTVSERVDEVKRKHPKMDVPPLPPRRPRPEKASANAVIIYADPWPDDKPHPRDIEKYNQALDSFYEAYQKYLVEWDKAQDLNARKLALKIQLVNSGTAPVESAVVFLKIPGSLRLTQDQEKFKYPQAPEPPERPEPRRHSMMRDWFSPQRVPDFLSVYRPNTYVKPPNVERNNFSHDEHSYNVSFNVTLATHNLVYNCPYDLFVIFESLEDAHSFRIDYQIIGANMPKSVDGQLHVIARRDVSASIDRAPVDAVSALGECGGDE